MFTRRHLIALSATSAFAPGLLVGRSALAQTAAWPNRAVHMIVPLAAGGPTDSNARILADQLTTIWGQQVVVDNRSGAGTNIGNEIVAHADPDGYTMLFGTSSIGVNASLYRSLSYNPITDLAPVSLVAKFPFFMFVPNSSPAKTVMELVAYAKANPGKLVMGSPGTGSAPHLSAELFEEMAQIKMTHSPYRGAAPAFIDLIPGRIDCYFGSGELLQYWRSGQVRALATTGVERSTAAPELPTIAEAGITGYSVLSWQGVFVPAKTPPGLVQKMSADVIAALAVPAVKEKLEHAAYAAQGSTPQELANWLKSDSQKWAALIKSANIRID